VKPERKTIILDVLPTVVNVVLTAYLAWQLNLMPYFQRQGEFQIFSVLYAVGGLVIAVSGFAAFVHAAETDKAARRLFMLALVNITIPTILLLVLLKFR
jgi:heme O synthase-like polyprenyltransferase